MNYIGLFQQALNTLAQLIGKSLFVIALRTFGLKKWFTSLFLGQ
jgi:hypothetical protein